MTEPMSGAGLRDYLERHARGEADPNEPPMFVLHQHQAGDMHFNLRFEVAQSFLSWRLPDAPWPNPEAKRAAIPVADYPLERATFEGANPAGEYGGGAMLVWDAGPFRLLEADDPHDPQAMLQATDKGRLQVWLDGQKLRGGWSLMRSGGDSAWVLEKMHDEHADPDANLPSRRPESVLSGQRIEDLTGFDPQSTRALGDRGDEGNLYGGRRPDA